MAQDYGELDNGRRRLDIDEDALNYDYEYDNVLPPKGVPESLAPIPAPPPPPRRRVVQPPNQRNQYSPNQQQYGPSRNQGLTGKDACKSGAKTVAHESSCDLFYDCYGDQGFLQECPNGLVYANDGRFGLLGSCDYPHNVNCNSRPERSKYLYFYPN